ncbi:type 1 glutamine amidotransferase family protein [Paenibacillus typhae]|uniref:Putative intracellular protease/amidase n=1 Tax=Paenibacillus typhae TaxID=1174501 RepID=A0A1G8ZV91_9BACL|nr:type 1 glutamine amidotransferase family protein [Paenibacillus typhae]SDK19042.1 Putative intracellular protease/amidase [Paenibacillus typhae]
MNHTVYLYVCDTMADWEIGYLTAELNSGRYYKKGQAPSKLVTVGINKTPITTMGGLTLMPDITLEECSPSSGDLLILPGGETWTDSIHEPILRAAGRCLEDNIGVAAICGATMGLARTGLLDTRAHTSNDLEYLKMVCPAYTGEQHYKLQPAVTDGNLITASGIAPLEFTVHVLRALDVFSDQTLEAWYNLYKTQEPKYFYELMSGFQE